MNASASMITVRANVELSPAALQAIVENAKRLAGTGEKGYYTVDTADKVSEMISRFLQEKGFDAYVRDIRNYET